MNKSTLFTFLILIILVGCEVSPSKINYGTDSCHFCKMTIVKHSHATQLVTSKGRAYKFDAIECMVQSLPQWEDEELAYILVTDYLTPKKLIPAHEAYFLISPSIPSPMGANLSAFLKKSDRNRFILNPNDKALGWEELKLTIF